jgi:hypothetical protein
MPVILGILVGIGIALRRSVYRMLKRSWEEKSKQSTQAPTGGDAPKPSGS